MFDSRNTSLIPVFDDFESPAKPFPVFEDYESPTGTIFQKKTDLSHAKSRNRSNLFESQNEFPHSPAIGGFPDLFNEEIEKDEAQKPANFANDSHNQKSRSSEIGIVKSPQENDLNPHPTTGLYKIMTHDDKLSNESDKKSPTSPSYAYEAIDYPGERRDALGDLEQEIHQQITMALFGGKQSIAQAVFSMMKSCFSTMIFAVPRIYSQAGPISATLLLILFGFKTRWTTNVLVKTGVDARQNNYPGLLYICFGNTGYYLFHATVMIYGLTNLIEFTRIFGSSVSKVLTYSTTETFTNSWTKAILDPKSAIFVFSYLAFFPISTRRDISILSKFSVVLIILVVLIIICMICAIGTVQGLTIYERLKFMSEFDAYNTVKGIVAINCSFVSLL